jgi:hypothetical protein
MLHQTAVMSGGFSVGILGRRSRPKPKESYQRSHSFSEARDLLYPQSTQSTVSQDWQDIVPRETPSILGAQTTSRPLSLELDVDESEDDVSEGLRKLISKVQGIRQPARLHPQERRRFLPRVTDVLSEDSKRILGEDGLRRFEEFKHYHLGWDSGHGKPLSSHSVSAFQSFLERWPELADCEPSLFLTHQGNLQLGWKDAHDHIVELEFFRDKIEFYLECLNEEGSVLLDAQQQLVDKIRSIIS